MDVFSVPKKNKQSMTELVTILDLDCSSPCDFLYLVYQCFRHFFCCDPSLISLLLICHAQGSQVHLSTMCISCDQRHNQWYCKLIFGSSYLLDLWEYTSRLNAFELQWHHCSQVKCTQTAMTSLFTGWMYSIYDGIITLWLCLFNLQIH